MIKLAEIKEAILSKSVYVTNHAFNEMRNDKLSLDDVLYGSMTGEIIRQYVDDKPFPSCLILGKTTNGKLFHSVWAYDKIKKGAILVTVYVPDKDIWDKDFKIKKG